VSDGEIVRGGKVEGRWVTGKRVAVFAVGLPTLRITQVKGPSSPLRKRELLQKEQGNCRGIHKMDPKQYF